MTISGASTICSYAHAAFTVSGSGPTYTFANMSTPSTMPAGVGVTFYIKYGDGSASNPPASGSSFGHTYTQNGTFNVRLYATYYTTTLPTQVLCTDSVTAQIVVTNAPNNFDATVTWDSSSAPSNVQIKFWLIQYDAATQTLSAVDSATSTYPGWGGYAHVLFTNKPNGSYRLKTHMLNQPVGTSGYVPTYYDSSLNWSTATVMNCTACGTTYAYWQLKHGTATAGPGFVGGSVLAGANKGTATGDPVASQLILLRNASGTTIRSTYTNAAGQYSFSDVPVGEYTVYPEEMNYATTPSASFPITGFQNTKTGMNFRKNGNARTIVPAVSAPTGVAAFNASALRVHPNPTTGLVTVQLAAAASDVTVRVTAVTGQEVYVQTVSAATAVRGWMLDLSGLPAGFYNLNLKSTESSRNEKLLLQR